MLRAAALKLQRGGCAAAHAAASCGLQPSSGSALVPRVAPAGSQRLYSGHSGEDEPSGAHDSRVAAVADQILQLNLLEVSQLTELLRKRLNIQAPAFGAAMGLPLGMPALAAPAGAVAPDSQAEAPKEEKTAFDVKLEAYDAAAKIKVIKEIRAITDLGLKEAKELVEGSPTVVKAGVKKDEAEELKKKLEAAGAKVSLA